MKKLVCILLTSLLVCLPAAALAENEADPAAIELFDHDWVNEQDQDDCVTVGQEEDGAWYVVAMRYGEDDELFGVEFEKCMFDTAQNAIVCEGGTLTRGGFLNTEDEEDEGEEEAETVEQLSSGFGAVLIVDENGRLHWTGSGDAWADRTYINFDEEDDGMFVGEWECGDAQIDVDLRAGAYLVRVLLDVNEQETACWEYTGVLNQETGALALTGTKSIFTLVDEENEETEAIVYTDGEATITLDGSTLLWNDAREDAGQGLRFERWQEEEEEA